MNLINKIGNFFKEKGKGLRNLAYLTIATTAFFGCVKSKERIEGKIESDMPIVYQTDFSTNPDWKDDDVLYHKLFPPFADNHRWRENEQDYFIRAHMWMGNEPPIYTPNRYTYHKVPWTGSSFELTWDQYMEQTQWSAGITFGLFDEDMPASANPLGNCIIADFARGDQGRIIAFEVQAEGKAQHVWVGDTPYFQDDTWYNCKIFYNSVAQTASLKVVEKNTGNLIDSVTLSIPIPFTAPLNRLGSSRVGVNWPYSGVNSRVVAEGYIDNVKLKMIH